jgi:hypothetical protein
VPDRVYNSNPDNFFVMYTYNVRPERTATFRFQRTAPGQWDLTEIYFADRQRLGSSVRVMDWRISIYTGSLPSGTNYKFVPPSNARAVANLRGT